MSYTASSIITGSVTNVLGHEFPVSTNLGFHAHMSKKESVVCNPFPES